MRTQPRKLPFWRTVGAAYRSFFSQFGELIAISRLWCIVGFLMLSVVNWLAWPWWLTEWLEAFSAFTPESSTQLARSIINLVTMLIWIPIASSIAVAWHRLLLLGERVGYRYLRWDSLTLTYAILLAMLSLPSSFVDLLQLYHSREVGNDETAVTQALETVYYLFYIAFAIFFARCSLILPAKSVGHEHFGLSEAAAFSTRNTFRMIFGILVTALGPIAFWVLLFLISLYWVAGLDRAMVSIVWAALNILLFLPATAIGIGFLSFAYGYLVQGRQPGEITSSLSKAVGAHGLASE